jgi:hypothetical protein
MKCQLFTTYLNLRLPRPKIKLQPIFPSDLSMTHGAPGTQSAEPPERTAPLSASFGVHVSISDLTWNAHTDIVRLNAPRVHSFKVRNLHGRTPRASSLLSSMAPPRGTPAPRPIKPFAYRWQPQLRSRVKRICKKPYSKSVHSFRCCQGFSCCEIVSAAFMRSL